MLAGQGPVGGQRLDRTLAVVCTSYIRVQMKDQKVIILKHQGISAKAAIASCGSLMPPLVDAHPPRPSCTETDRALRKNLSEDEKPFSQYRSQRCSNDDTVRGPSATRAMRNGSDIRDSSKQPVHPHPGKRPLV